MSIRGDRPVYLTSDTFYDSLYKRGKFNKGWKERYFAVYRSEQTIEYYSTADDRKQRKNMCGSIDLSTVSNLQVITNTDAAFQRLGLNPLTDHIAYNEDAKSDKAYTFELITRNRTYIFAAYNQESQLKWLKYLQSCLYGEVVKQGWLQIQGHRNKKQWKTRYCVLDRFQQLKYYYDKQLKTCRGVIDCTNIDRLDNGKIYGNGLQHTIELQSKSKTYIFVAISQNDRSEWLRYMNVMKGKEWMQELKEMNSKQDQLYDVEEKESRQLVGFKIYKRPKDDASDDEEDDLEDIDNKMNKMPQESEENSNKTCSISCDSDNEPHNSHFTNNTNHI